MSRNLSKAIAYFDFVVAAALAVWGLFLATSPLHPPPGDSHGGLMAVFPGLLLVLLAALTYGSGKLLLRQRTWGWLLQVLVAASLVFLVVMLSTE